jgi:alpha-beta hydrolase superfamily lysophospholipase
MGTGYIPKKTTNLAKTVTRFLAAFRGWHYRSKFVADSSFGKPYRQYDLTGKTLNNSWLTKDEAIVKWYYAEPKCSFVFTLNGYMGLFEAVECACNPQTVEKYPKNLPVFLISGADDPVGDMGEGVLKVYHLFKAANMEDITYKLYESDRHELLNETDKETVYADILSWITIRK